MVDEDGISCREVLDTRSCVKDMPCGGVTVFDGECVAPREGGQVQSEVLRNLAAVDEHLRARAHGRGEGLDAYLSGSGRRYDLLAQLRRAWGGKREGSGLQFIPDPGCHRGIRYVR